MVIMLIKYEVLLFFIVLVVENLSVVIIMYNFVLFLWSYIENVYFEIQVLEDIKNVNVWQVVFDSFKLFIKEVDYIIGFCYFIV